MIKNVKDTINYTIKTTENCTEFEEYMDETISFMREGVPDGYVLDIYYITNCDYWNNNPPEPAPLKLTVHIIGKNLDSISGFDLYHTH